MIGNPVIKKSGGSQVYKITDNSGWGFPESATAGEFVVAIQTSGITDPIVIDSHGNTVPVGLTTGITRVAEYHSYFVMPASDVTIG